MSAPTDALARLAQHLREGDALDPSDRDRLAAGIEQWLRSAAGSLDEALGLARRPGERDVRTLAAIARRDRLLREAAARFYPAASRTRQAFGLHRDLNRYAASSWLRERHLDRCPERHAGRAEALFWALLRERKYVPEVGTIRRILASN